MLRPEHLAYFKDLFEGRAEISWNAWFKLHEAQLSQDLPRLEFLHLKFNKLDEAEKYLMEAGVPYTSSPMVKRERYYAELHPSALDANGRPNIEFQRKAYNGLLAVCLTVRLQKPRGFLLYTFAKSGGVRLSIR